MKKDVSEQYVEDAYKDFFNEFKIDEKDFINYGIGKIIFATKEEALEQWQELKNVRDGKIDNKIYIRPYGCGKSDIFLKIYKEIFPECNIVLDKCNNNMSKQIFNKYLGKRVVNLKNYQCSHIFEHTKNPFMFTARWNICFTPKIYDPFTGHEASGTLKEKFQNRLRDKTKKIFPQCIEEYNSYARLFEERIVQVAQRIGDIKDRKRFVRSVKEQWKII